MYRIHRSIYSTHKSVYLRFSGNCGTMTIL